MFAFDREEDLAKIFARFFRETSFDDLPPAVVEEVKKQVVDFFGCAVAGAMKPGPVQVRGLNLHNGGAQEARVWGPGVKLPVAYAAQCNATAGHALDFDDVHDAVMHPGVISMSTAMALADYREGMTGKELITAVALGAEMIVRMNLGMHPGNPVIPYGWHTTSLNGNLVSANLAAKILGLDFDQTVFAIGLGYHQACGNGQTTKDGGFAKRVGPGFAVRNGITAALLAERGLTAAINSFEGEWGFVHTYMFDDFDREAVIAELGERWEAGNVLCKPYPCCRGTHNFADAGIYLRKTYDIDPEQIERIDCLCGKGTLNLLGQPLSVKAHPKTPADVQFSCAWGVASGLAKGQATLKEYSDSEEGIFNPEIRAVAAKIATMEYSPDMDPKNPEVSKYEGAKVTVTMKDGAVHSVYLPSAKGCADNPQSYEDVVTKYYGNLAYAEVPIPETNGRKIAELCADLEQLDDVRVLNELMVWEHPEHRAEL